MYVDPNHEGLRKYRAHRAYKKEIAIIANELFEEHPNKTIAECKQMAVEEYEARLAESLGRERKKKKKSRKPDKMGNVEVVVVNKIKL